MTRCLECWIDLDPELIHDRGWYEICEECLAIRWEGINGELLE